MSSPVASILAFIFGVALIIAAWLLLRKLDPPKEPGETRFEGVLPNLRGLAIYAAIVLLVFGCIIALVFAPIFYLH